MKTLDDILFDVVEEPIPTPQILKSDAVTWNGDPSNYKMLIRKDTGNVISVVTKDYKLVKNEEIVNTVMDILKDDKPEITEVTNWADRRFGLRLQFPQEVDIPDGGTWSKVNPVLNLRNSYDTQLGLHVLGGAFVFVCSNGLVIGVRALKRNYQHKVSNQWMNNLPKMFTRAKNLMRDIFANQIPLLADTGVKPDDIEYVQNYFPKRYHKDMLKYIYNGDRITNFWNLYQMGTYLTSHVMPRKYESTHKLEDDLFGIVRDRATWRKLQ